MFSKQVGEKTVATATDATVFLINDEKESGFRG